MERNLPHDIKLILDDRESGSVLLLNRLIKALEEELHPTGPGPEESSHVVITIKEEFRLSWQMRHT
jgi:hypothetical protein